MTNRYPLIIDAQTQRIRELPLGDNLDLTGNAISSVRDILPEDDSTYNLGSNSKRWKDLYLSGDSIFLGDGIISYNSQLKKFTFSEEIAGILTDVSVSLDGNTTDDLSEGSNNLYYSDSRARLSISVVDNGGDGSLSYNNETGTITYTGPSAEEVRAHFSAGTGVTITDGEISIGQSVEPTDNVTFNDVQINGDLDVVGDITIGGNITIGNETIDNITVVADFTSNLIPRESNEYDLGSANKKWRSAFLRTANVRQTLVIGTDNEATAEINTESATINLVNAVATSVNFAGAATSVAIGSTTGTTTVKNSLVVQGDSTVSVQFNSSSTQLQPPVEGDYKGERLRLYDFNSLSKTNYAIGVEQSHIWFGVDTNNEGQGFKWYGNTVEVMRLSASGNLIVEGNITLSGSITAESGTVLTEGTGIDQITVFTKSITLTQDWQDVGINSTDLGTGTYFVQMYANDISAGGTNSNEYYSGTMSWFAGATDSSAELPTDEIVLHRAGASSDAGLYLRTFRTAAGNADNLKLQIYSNFANSSASNYVFKFRRMI